MKKTNELQYGKIMPYPQSVGHPMEGSITILELNSFYKKECLCEDKSIPCSFLTIITPLLVTDFRTYTPPIKLVERMKEILEKLENNEDLNDFDLVFCEAMANYYSLSVTYCNPRVKNIIFCLRDRLAIDPHDLNANTAFTHEIVTVVPLDNEDELRKIFSDIFKRISDQEIYLEFAEIYEKFSVLAVKHLTSIHFDKIIESRGVSIVCKNYRETNGYGIYDNHDYYKQLSKRMDNKHYKKFEN